MSVSATQSLFSIPTGMTFPKPSILWIYDAVAIGDAGGGSISGNIDVMPGSFGSPDARIATVESFTLDSSVAQDTILVRWGHRTFQGGTTHFMDVMLDCSMKKPAAYSYYSMLHQCGNPSNNQPVGFGLHLPWLKQLSYVDPVGQYSLSLLSWTLDNANLKQVVAQACGYAWDKQPQMTAAVDNASWRA